MAYATADDVQARLDLDSGTGIALSANSVPPLAQVEDFVAQVSAEINGVLRAQGYGSVPATGANDLLLLRRYVSEKAAAMTYHAGYGGFGDVPARVARWEEDYADFLLRLRKGQQQLIDQAPSSTAAGSIQTGTLVLERWAPGDEWSVK